MATDRTRALDTTFRKRFLPPGASSGHALLLDGNETIAFAPDDQQLTDCLTAYETLVEQVSQPDPMALLDVRDATETTLATLYRGLDAGCLPPPVAVRSRLSTLLRRVLSQAAEQTGVARWNGEMRRYDGIKTAEALAGTLAILNEDEEFRKRFLPHGVDDPYLLLTDFQQNVPFTPSDALLHQCLESYSQLIERASRVTCHPARWCLGSTELTMAHLSRALQAGTATLERATAQRLAELLRKVLADARGHFGAMRWYDGYKRMDLLAWLLEENTPRGFQGWHLFRARLKQTLRL